MHYMEYLKKKQGLEQCPKCHTTHYVLCILVYEV